jgi:hypothetical protein
VEIDNGTAVCTVGMRLGPESLSFRGYRLSSFIWPVPSIRERFE